MKQPLRIGWLAALLPVFLMAQGANRPASVEAQADAVVQVKPDLAKLDVGVVTQAATAQAAASQNASQLEATLTKLRAALGAAGEIRTQGYSLQPNYQYPRGGGQPSIDGYTASNTVEVTTTDLAALGKLIDTATAGGANRVQGVQFLVKNQAPARAEALRQAVREARANAEAMAEAMGMKLGRVLEVQQGAPAPIRPLVREAAALAVAAPTPVQPGTVEVRATVTVRFAIE